MTAAGCPGELLEVRLDFASLTAHPSVDFKTLYKEWLGVSRVCVRRSQRNSTPDWSDNQTRSFGAMVARVEHLLDLSLYGSVDFLLLSSLPFLSSRPEPVCLRQVPRALEFPAVFAGAGRSLTAVGQLEGSPFAGLEFASKDVNRASGSLR